MEAHTRLVEQLGAFVEPGDAEAEVAKAELQVVGDPARRRRVHAAVQANDDGTAIEPRVVASERGRVDDR